MQSHQTKNVIWTLFRNVAQDLDIIYAMSNSLGFGGHNAVLVFKNLKTKIK